jgi:hypothetical protein
MCLPLRYKKTAVKFFNGATENFRFLLDPTPGLGILKFDRNVAVAPPP